MQEVNIRAASPADIPRLVELWQEKMVLLQQSDSRFAGPPDWSTALTGWLEDECCAVYVAERENKVIGFSIGWIPSSLPGLLAQPVGYITDLTLDTHVYQGGLGRLLVRPLRDWFAAHNIQNIVTCVPHRHAVEQAFWRAYGATPFLDFMWIKP